MKSATLPLLLGLLMGLPVPRAGAAVPAPESRAWRDDAIRDGRLVIEKFQCGRCHEISGEKEWAQAMSCRDCHAMVASTKDKPEVIRLKEQTYPDWSEYVKNVRHYLTVPNLSKLGARVRPDFIERFLAAPFDLRPALEESMIRTRMTPADIRAVVRYFAARGGAPDPYPGGATVAVRAAAPPPRNEAQVVRGEVLFAAKGCASCHLFGNKDFGAMVNADFLKTMGRYAALAPDLRFARERVRPEVLVDWIIDARAIDPATPMPPTNVARDEAEALAQFLLYGQIPPFPVVAARPPAPRPPPQKVTYEMLDRAIFSKICIHCHEQDGETDNGAGNGGGLGYKGKGFSFASVETFKHGSRTADGTYASVLRKGESGKPVLLERLELRVEENRRDHVKPFGEYYDHAHVAYPVRGPGMPLGLPALPPETLDMIRAWIADGAKTEDGTSLLPGKSSAKPRRR